MMRVDWLALTHFRGIHRAEFEFHPNMNLFVGDNGAGKTSLLECLRVLLSQVMPNITPAPRYNIGFDQGDIMHEREKLMAEMSFSCHDIDFYFLVHKQRDKYVTTRNLFGEEKTVAAKEVAELSPINFDKSIRNIPHQPIVLFFSTRRSIISQEKAKNSSEQRNAYSRSMLIERGLRLRDFADWWRAKLAIAFETKDKKHLAQIDTAIAVVSQMLPEVTNWRLDDDGIIWVDKHKEVTIEGTLRSETCSLTLDQLSDGERSLIVLAFDITRRLIQANPNSEDAVREGTGVVIIDELDLHLHPKWQRRIVSDLLRIFPKIQFIATTHSTFLVQSLIEGKLFLLDGELSAEYADESIENIAENIMGVEMPQKSERYLQMMETAEKYFALLERTDKSSPEELQSLKDSLDELMIPFSDDPGFSALLKFQRNLILDGKENEN